jgi:antitoxin FitA
LSLESNNGRLISWDTKDIIDIYMRESKSTTAVTIRNIPVEIHRALRVRAAQRGHSTEAEIRLILEAAVKNEGRIKLGSLLAQIGRECGGVDLTIERDRRPTEPVSFE